MRTFVTIILCTLVLFGRAQIEKDLWHWQPIDSLQVTCLYEFTYLNFLYSNERRERKEKCILQIGKNLKVL